MWYWTAVHTFVRKPFYPLPCSTPSTDRTTAVSAGGLCSKLHNSVLRTTSILLIRTSTAAVSEGIHSSGAIHLLPSRLHHRRSLLAQARTRLEPELAASADIVLANSSRFAAELLAYNPETYPIETGVNIELYDASRSYGIPADIKGIPHPSSDTWVL